MKTTTTKNASLGWTKGDFKKKDSGSVTLDLILTIEKDLNMQRYR